MTPHDVLLAVSAVFLSVVPYLAILVCVVGFHEMGHYLAGRAVGARVHSFAIGFGRELLGRTDRAGVRWKVCAIPLGGYVRFVGDADPSSRPDRSALLALPPHERAGLLAAMSPGRRSLVMAAGPAANFLLAAVVLSGLFLAYGREDFRPLVSSVAPGSPADEAGIQPGDVIVSLDGWPVDSLRGVRDILQDSGGRPVLVGVDRAGRHLRGVATPRLRESRGPFGRQDSIVLGIEVSADPSNRVVQSFGPPSAALEGLRETWRISRMTVFSVANMIDGRMPITALSGPVKMVQISRVTATTGGLRGLVGLLAVISVSVGIINLLPIPVLDGGHLAMAAVEALIGRPIPDRALDVVYRFGFAVIACLVILVTVNDLLNLIDRGG